MLTNAYTVYDRKALTYAPPFFALQDGLALRMFGDAINDPGTSLFRHPGDYVLYRCGAYDDASGQLLPVTVLEHIADAQSLVRTTTDGPHADRSNALPPSLPVNE
jgi:hypothetical protein